MFPRLRVFTVLGLFALLTAVSGRPALAAPQILGLVASNDALPLQCEGGFCSTEASVFCLQKWRMSPVAGTSFYTAGGEGVRLVAKTDDGDRVVIPNPELKVAALRGHNAVRIGVDVDWMDKRGYASAVLEIGQMVSLIPKPFKDDPKPQTARDIEVAIGPLREIGNKLVDNGGVNIAAAQIVNQIANKLPRLGRASDEIRAAAWDKHTAGLKGGDAKAWKKAKASFTDCQDRTFGGYVSLRQCLSSQHDIMVGKLNTRYWQATDQNM